MRFLIAAAVVTCSCLGTAHGASAAKTLCGQKVHEKFDETRIYSRDFIAACQPGGTCRIVTYRLENSAPLGFSHHLAFARRATDDRWHVETVSVLDLADMNAGFKMIVDRNPAMEIDTGQVTAPVSVNEYVFSQNVSDEILAAAKPGNVIRWEYTTNDGELREAGFSLIGLSNALKWAECAQKSMASGKSDPATGNDETVEFSQPEPDVPISPDDSKD